MISKKLAMITVTVAWMFGVALALWGWLLMNAYPAYAQDVYNFYFQKGGAPQNVIQSGAGQTTTPNAAPTPTASIGPQPEVAPANANTAQLAPALLTDEKKSYHPWAMTLGYGSYKDNIDASPTVNLGLKYRFSPYVDLRFAVLYHTTERNYGYEQNYTGFAALGFTPFKIDLMGHEFVSFSAYVGTETSRHRNPNNTTIFNSLLGFSTNVAINEHVGLELQAHRSRALNNSIAANLVVNF